jgi:hypothetical protein
LVLPYLYAFRRPGGHEERGSQDFRRGVLILGFFAAALLIGTGLAM